MSFRVLIENASFGWIPDLIGCATVAPDETSLLKKLPRTISEYRSFVHRHGGQVPVSAVEASTDDLVVVERVTGDEVLFDDDRADARVEDIERTITLLCGSRQDLLRLVADVPEDAFEWDPPYVNYPAWAKWCTIGEVLAHIAICETRYYLRGIGYSPGPNPPTPGGLEPGSRAWYAALGRDWRALLARTRGETVAFLHEVAHSPDRRRIHEEPGYCWSVRKALRRLVWHELAHTKNIRRIHRDFGRRP